MRIGVIGIGNMGRGMAANLLAAGHEVTVYNRTPGKTAELEAKGARPAASPAEACQGDAVLTMLSNDAALEAVVYGSEDQGGILESLGRGAVHISSSTISVALSERLSVEHAEAGQEFVAAPVFGRPEAAAAGKLFVIAAGAPGSVGKVAAALEAVGQRTFVVSEQPQAANLVKLSGNFLIATVIESLGEAMALVGKGGVDRAQYLDILTSTLFNAPVYKTYGGLVAERRFEPAGFPAHLGLKDMRLALAAADDLSVPLPIANLLRDRFLALRARGEETLDWSAIGLQAARDAGLES